MSKSTAEKREAYLNAYPDEFKNVMAGACFFGPFEVWEMAFEALEQGKKIVFEPGNPDNIGEMTYRYE